MGASYRCMGSLGDSLALLRKAARARNSVARGLYAFYKAQGAPATHLHRTCACLSVFHSVRLRVHSRVVAAVLL